MKARGTAVLGGLAAVGLVAAYVTWQREPSEKSANAVTVLDISKRDLQKVRYDDHQKWIELYERDENGERSLWVHTGVKEQPVEAKADAGTLPDGGAIDAGTPPPPTPERELRANEVAETLWKKFAPMVAVRSLGVVDDAKLDELGLKTPARQIEVKAGNVDEKFDVGTSTLGISSPYFRSDRDHKVYLMSRELIGDFDAGSNRLVDRRLHAYAPGDYDELVVKVKDHSKDLMVVPGATPMQAKFAPKGSPSTPDDFAKNWSDKVGRSFALELLGRGEEPPGGAPEPHFRIDYLKSGKPLGFIEVAPVGAALYARTEHTASWVKISPGGEGMMQEADRVVAEDRK